MAILRQCARPVFRKVLAALVGIHAQQPLEASSLRQVFQVRMPESLLVGWLMER